MAEQKIRSIQVLRFVAAFQVVILHAYIASIGANGISPFLPHIGVLNFGVDLFFVISGFIITRIAFGDRRPAPADFLLKRWLRIAPLYYLTGLALIPFFWRWIPPESYVPSFLFWPAFTRGNVQPINIAGWTLCFEMLFYACAAFILAGKTLPRLLILGAAFGASLWMRYVLYVSFFDYLGNPMIIEFLFGVIVARTWRGPNPVLGAVLIAGAVLFLCWIAIVGAGMIGDGIPAFNGTRSFLRVEYFGTPAFAVVLGAVRLESLFRSRFWSWAVFAGDASYSLYLVNPLVGTALPDMPFLLIASVSLLCGLTTYQWIERPLLHYVRRPFFRDGRAPRRQEII